MKVVTDGQNVPIHKEDWSCNAELADDLLIEFEQAITTQQEFIDKHSRINFEDYVIYYHL